VSDRQADVAEIESIVQADRTGADQTVWRERSWVVTADGVELEGRTAIWDGARTGGEYAPGTVELLGGDVAIVHAYGRTVVALYVLAREHGRWQIVARQDSPISG
jgi:hypothetical protein